MTSASHHGSSLRDAAPRDATPRAAAQRAAAHRSAAPHRAAQRSVAHRAASPCTATQRLIMKGPSKMRQDFTNSRALERQALCDCLRRLSEGEIATYAALSIAAGVDVLKARYLLSAPIRELRDEEGIVFKAERRIGLRRLTAIEIATERPVLRRRKAHRQANLGLKELATIGEPSQLPPGERLQLSAGISLLAAIATATTAHAARRITRALASAEATLPVEQTLAALKGIR